MSIGRLAHRMGLRPIPFGGQVLMILAVHAVLTDLAARGLTVTHFFPIERKPGRALSGSIQSRWPFCCPWLFSSGS